MKKCFSVKDKEGWMTNPTICQGNVRGCLISVRNFTSSEILRKEDHKPEISASISSEH